EGGGGGGRGQGARGGGLRGGWAAGADPRGDEGDAREDGDEHREDDVARGYARTPISARNVPITACTSARCVRFGKCGPPCTTCRRACGIVSATRRDIGTVGKWSCDPAITSTGHRMRAHSAIQ